MKNKLWYKSCINWDTMQTQCFQPSPALRSFIKGYVYHNIDTDKRVYFMPNEYPFLTINLGEGYDVHSDKHHGECFKSHYFVGHTKSSYSVSSRGKLKGIGVYFEPAALCQLLRLSLDKITGTSVTVSDLEDKEFYTIVEKITHTNNMPKCISLLDSFFLKKATKTDLHRIDMDFATAFVRRHKGDIAISDIADRLNISIRTLERRFMQYIGLTPKQYAKIIRINSVMRMLNSSGLNRLTDIAYQFGYYDQTHFIKEFKSFTGIKPTGFAMQSRPFSLGLSNLWLASAPKKERSPQEFRLL